MIRIPTILLSILALALSGTFAHAQQSSGNTLLQQLDQETQAIYQRVQLSLVDVRMNTPIAFNELLRPGHPLSRWTGQLDPVLLDRLRQQEAEARAGMPQPVQAMVVPTTQPIPQIQFNAEIVSQVQGVICDDQGHVLIPIFLQKRGEDDTVGVKIGGRLVQAKLIGSDRQTGLTVMQLKSPHNGASLHFSERTLPDGALVMLLTPQADEAKLIVWTGPQRERNATIVVGSTGDFEGFARDGHFMTASACRAIVDQLIQNGSVKRGFLGVHVREIRNDDPLRQQIFALGGQPAMRIEEILPETAAQRAGLKVGDLILAIADQPVGDAVAFAAAIANRMGRTELQILRDGRIGKITVELSSK